MPDKKPVTHTDDSGTFECPLGSSCDDQPTQKESAHGVDQPNTPGRTLFKWTLYKVVSPWGPDGADPYNIRDMGDIGKGADEMESIEALLQKVQNDYALPPFEAFDEPGRYDTSQIENDDAMEDPNGKWIADYSLYVETYKPTEGSPKGPAFDSKPSEIVDEHEELHGHEELPEIDDKDMEKESAMPYQTFHDKEEGLCPICGVGISLTGKTKDGRLIGSCGDAFTVKQWEAPDDGSEAKKCPECGADIWDASNPDQKLNKCWSCGARWMDDPDEDIEDQPPICPNCKYRHSPNVSCEDDASSRESSMSSMAAPNDPPAPPVEKESPVAPNELGLEEMAKRRIDYANKLAAINEQIRQFQEHLQTQIQEMQNQVAQEEPLLIEALKKTEDWTAIIDGWTFWVKKGHEPYNTIRYKKILEKVMAKAQKIAPELYKLGKQLEKTKGYFTPVERGDDDLQIERPASLKIKADWNEMWGQFKQWLSGVFSPSVDALDAEFQEMDGLLQAAEGQPA